MKTGIVDQGAPKKSTNLSINSDLLRQARERKINLSQLLEITLTEVLREEKGLSWREENREAIAAYNRRVAAGGVFSDGQRRF